MSNHYKEYIGKGYPPGKPISVTADAVKKFAESVGDMRPDYLNGSLALPSFANHIFVKSLGGAVVALKGLVKNPGKILHAGETYEYIEPVKPGDTITTTGKVANVYEKANMLWIVTEAEAQNQHGRTAIKATMTLAVRPGGF
ncbi:MAG: MaoC family dehydratase N-terminal domain-containing protein [Euryarchaeota archaeon]|nr:MaoC family dehydratase N-terminal domain-containing protein [Euryarchaeota archaeon]